MYKIIKEKRKTVTLLIDDELNIIVKVPYYYTKKQAEELLKKHENWIEKTLAYKKIIKQENNWVTNKKIMYLGQYRKICIQEIESGNTTVEYRDNAFYLTVLKNIEESILRKMMETYIRKEAKKYLTELSEYYCKLLGCDYTNITIRKQKTRWGSCSSKGSLSYNVRLMCAPKKCIEYVALHEVMHRKHFNHGDKFWAEIKEIMPDYLERKDYLNKYGKYFQI